MANVVHATFENWLDANIADAYMPDMQKGLLLQAPGEFNGTLTEMMYAMGRWTQIDGPLIQHMEKGIVWESLGVNAQVNSPGQGNDATYTVPVAETLNGTEVYARVGDIIQYPDAAMTCGQIVEIDISVPNAVTYRVEPLNTTDTIPTVLAGQRLLVLTNAFDEGTGGPEGRVGDATTISHTDQIIKDKFTVSGTEYSNAKAWVTVRNEVTGEVGQKWYFVGATDTKRRFFKQIDNAMLTMPGSINNPNTTGGRVMLGMFPFVENGGNVVQYALGNWDISDLDTLIDLFKAQMLGGRNSEYLLAGAHTFCRMFEDKTLDHFGDGVIYGSFDGQKELALAMGVKSICRSDFTFHKKELVDFSNPNTFNIPGYGYQRKALVIPMIKMGQDQAGNSVPLWEMTYRPGRKIKTWWTGSAGEELKGRETTDVDIQEQHFLAHCGTRLKGANYWGMFKV